MKWLLALIVVVALAHQYRDTVRGWMGLPPLAAVAGSSETLPAVALKDALAEGRTPQVVMYATPTCPYCEKARRFLAANDVPYIEKNVNRSASAAEEMRDWGGRGVPTIVIDDETVLKGWSARGLEQALVRAALAP